ncbi:dihydrolipoyl dehydrogenase [Sedimentisphaera salicampi]|uniref:Dihydrolipoyl dehydrogenase n=1 Tax=Sedimentisphaera salicampi TaxID=1941349 RepID=A0A1W6LNS2_9BACT|nr:dihydrolipoyl dehydrogenase [Sedimentisphaera salicampi]ARN57429.1 Dihydrolipoyl dehydrogenase [Sedimentisphaera salicampi]
MTEKDAVIIGAGSGGLSALRQIKNATDNYLMIDPGPLGTKCARVGCMPSKALIKAANDFHRRHKFQSEGISGAESLSIDPDSVMEYVRGMRDKFAGNMEKVTRKLAGDNLIEAKAKILAPDMVEAGGERIKTKSIVIATGASPLIPSPWREFGDRILTSETIFEQKHIPKKIAVIGLGVIGLELGQALSRIGTEVVGFDMKETLGGLTDESVKKRAIEAVGSDFPIHLGEAARLSSTKDCKITVCYGDHCDCYDAVLAAMGVSPNIEGLGLENLGVELNDRGLPNFNPKTAQISDLPVYIAGDVNGCRPILHEALDEGFIAGKNAAAGQDDCFCRRVPLRIVFSDPQIAAVGYMREELETTGREFVVGREDFSDQARAALEQNNKGLLHIYADNQTARFLGAEMAIPGAEHIAHQLAVAAQNQMTVFEMLQSPFYHPVLEEGLRSALRNAASKLKDKHTQPELLVCGSCPESPLC